MNVFLYIFKSIFYSTQKVQLGAIVSHLSSPFFSSTILSFLIVSVFIEDQIYPKIPYSIVRFVRFSWTKFDDCVRRFPTRLQYSFQLISEIEIINIYKKLALPCCLFFSRAIIRVYLSLASRVLFLSFSSYSFIITIIFITAFCFWWHFSFSYLFSMNKRICIYYRVDKNMEQYKFALSKYIFCPSLEIILDLEQISVIDH